MRCRPRARVACAAHNSIADWGWGGGLNSSVHTHGIITTTTTKHEQGVRRPTDITHSSPDSILCTPSSFATSSSHNLSRGLPLKRVITITYLADVSSNHSPQKHQSCGSPIFMQLHWEFEAEIDTGEHGWQDGGRTAHVVACFTGAWKGERVTKARGASKCT